MPFLTGGFPWSVVWKAIPGHDVIIMIQDTYHKGNGANKKYGLW